MGAGGVVKYASNGVMLSAVSLSAAHAGNNQITTPGASNLIIGGSGSNSIAIGAKGADVVIGANGEALFTSGVLTFLQSESARHAGDDTISGSAGAPGGSGGSVVIGGSGSNSVSLGGDRNTVIGANGEVIFGSGGVMTLAESASRRFAGNNHINVVGGHNLIIGGSGDNTITLGAAEGDFVIGANGQANFTNGVLTTIQTASPQYAGDNKITGPNGGPGGSDDNVVLGGSGNNTINIGGSNNVIFGANGTVTFSTSGVIQAATSAAPTNAGADTINVTGGANLIIGGTGADIITAGLGLALGTQGSVIVGDNGYADYTSGALTNVGTNQPGYGGADSIQVGDGNNVIFGGTGDDVMTAGAGDNVVLGDNGGVAITVAGALASVVSSNVGVAGGDNDVVRTGGGNNVIFGGAGSNKITTNGAGANIILGNDGYANFVTVSGVLTPANFANTDPTGGGGNTITTNGSSNSIIFGGGGNNTINGSTGNETIFGAFASYDDALPANARYLSEYTDADDGWGSNTINVGVGSNYVVGGPGANTITVAMSPHDGDNDIIGANNTPDGVVGADVIHGGSGNDVILGGSGQITRTVLVDNWQAMVWLKDPAPFNDTVRNVVVYDVTAGGPDVITDGDGMDRIYGAGGGNTITAGNGSDEIVGGLGFNKISAGDGADTIIAGEGQILRAYNADGTPLLNSDGSWHRNVVLETVGSITGAVQLDSAGNAALTSNLAAQLLSADMILLGGLFTASGDQVTDASADNAWETEALLVSVAQEGGSTVNVGNGNDVIFGGRSGTTRSPPATAMT